MKTYARFHFVIFLFFSSLINLQAQDKTEQYNANGLSTNIYNTSGGKITVFIPLHAEGERIAGSIKLEPVGKSANQRTKNLSKLQNYKLIFGSQTISANTGTFSMQSSGLVNTPIILLNEKGKKVSESYTVKKREQRTAPAVTLIPSYMVSGESASIMSNCDGNMANNNVRINKEKAELLAESESELFFRVPDSRNGASVCDFTNGTETVSSGVHVLGLQLSAGNLNLMKGQSTNLSIGVSGLLGLEDQVPMTITNNSPSNITLSGGNFQELTINPSTDASEGAFQTSRTIQAIRSGGFEISVNIVPPEYSITTSEEELLCNCYLNGQTHLISPDACVELGGNCSEDTAEDAPTDLEDESPSSFDCDLPNEVTENDQFVLLRIEDFNREDCIAVNFSIRPLGDEQWETLGQDNTPDDGLNFNWNPPLGYDGANEILVQVVNKNDVITEQSQYVYLNVTPAHINDVNLNVSYTVSEDAIKRAIDRARATGDKIKEQDSIIAELRRKYWDAVDSKKENEDARDELVAIDKIIEKIPKAYKDSLKAIVDSLSNLRKQLPAKIDKAALKKAVDDAQKRLDDCKKRLAELKKEQADLEAERDRLKQEMDDTLEEIDELFTNNGWTGGYGYHADGRPWFGYVGDENANTDLDERWDLKNKLRNLKMPYLKALKRLEQLPQEIADAEKECDELEKALEKAKEAAEKGDQYLAAEVEAEDICRQIKSLLGPIWSWCVKNPGECTFKEKLRKLLGKCPKDVADFDDFWDEFDDIVKAKKEQEEAYGDAAAADQDTIDDIENDITSAEEQKKKLKEQQDQEYAEAERLRKKRAQELEDARQRKRDAEARKKEEEKRNAAKPAPTLDEPIEADDDQLKFQAQIFIFKRLYRDYLIDYGPCHCKTKAMAFANNTNSIVSDLIGRIGVGVAFAPIEALPGVSLAGKIGIGAVKALASALFGGQSFSEELTKNLFNAIGGEIFPKLTGDGFTGNRLNDLAGKGLAEVLKAEGVRATSWEGKTKICGEEVSGKVNMLFNPNTGWVIILIKIDNCPLLVIKYKVNNDGVPLRSPKPSVTQIKG